MNIHEINVRKNVFSLIAYIYIYIYIIYIYINCTVNMGLTVSEKSVFPTSFGRGHFEGNLF